MHSFANMTFSAAARLTCIMKMTLFYTTRICLIISHWVASFDTVFDHENTKNTRLWSRTTEWTKTKIMVGTVFYTLSYITITSQNHCVSVSYIILHHFAWFCIPKYLIISIFDFCLVNTRNGHFWSFFHHFDIMGNHNGDFGHPKMACFLCHKHEIPTCFTPSRKGKSQPSKTWFYPCYPLVNHNFMKMSPNWLIKLWYECILVFFMFFQLLHMSFCIATHINDKNTKNTQQNDNHCIMSWYSCTCYSIYV